MSLSTRRIVAQSIPVALASLVFVAKAGAQPAPAPAAPLSIQALAVILQNMGYEPAADRGDKYFRITYNGSLDVNITFVMDAPGGVILMYVFLQKLSPDDVKNLDKVGVLEANDIRSSFFSLHKYDDSYSLYLQQYILPEDAKPALLRTAMTALAKAVSDTETLWNKAKWMTK